MISFDATRILAGRGNRVPPVARAVRAGETGTGLRRLKVLIVEDESVIAWALESLLEDLGHEVVDTVFSGEGAVASAADLAPDLVLMDINLGRGISGIDAAERIRLASRPAIIFVSAYNDPTTKGEIQSRVPGAPLLTKPIAAPALERSIENLFRRQH